MKSRDWQALLEANGPFVARAADAPYRVWGADLEAAALEQMKNACALPVARPGALMPDAHVGYGLPIGGVLATDDAVIPYAVGVDIACRMKMTVLDLPLSALSDEQARLTARDRARDALRRRRHVQDAAPARRDGRRLAASRRSPRKLKDRAWAQLGTSGSGNHFVEFGALTVIDAARRAAARASTSRCSATRGSRGTGAQIAQHYSKLARRLHPELPQELSHLAWLDLDVRGGPGVLGRDGADGPLRGGEPRADPPHIARALGVEVRLDHREPPQLRLERAARRPTAARPR